MPQPPPSAPSTAPSRNPARLPARRMNSDAGTVETAVPITTSDTGSVASPLLSAMK